MTVNYIGLILIIIGALFFAMAIIQPENFIVYKLFKARSTPCVGEGNEAKYMMAYSTMMIVFGFLVLFRVIGRQDGAD
eukprot:CAMPEP_0196239686 /NCGR_PEP_ID=MMETSP0913-20130531/11350_1 /TAXON_ID=49265 /ORGANISM="Thalassiosira rotula, Strain GSO102" /LENGTH=77 /DNA_ID=CAMNT_0041521707 /DNA_START=172 /DNA_END=405 /DNA_ORIENTATION=-